MIAKINSLNNVLITKNTGESSNGYYEQFIIKSTRFARSRIIQILNENKQEYVIFNGEVRFTKWS